MDLDKWVKLGKDLALEGEGLKKFVEEQIEKERQDRKEREDREREGRERERQEKEKVGVGSGRTSRHASST